MPRIGDRNVVIIFCVVALALVCSAWWAWREFKTSPPYVDKERYPILGIDVSAHNGMMNLDAAAKAGVDFIFIKASEGKTFRDENFAINYDKAQRVGLKIGVYHFFRFDVDGISQAHNLCRVLGHRSPDLGVAIDVEEHGNPKVDNDETIRREILQMAEYLNLRGYRVTLYTNRDGYYRFFDNVDFIGFPLWICSFSQNPINADWTFWQYDHHGRVAGIKTDVDLNTFNGSRQQWDALCRSLDDK